MNVIGGQELTHLKLLPGEEIRTPLIVLQFWQGGWVRSQNIWRRWMIAHNLPRPGGKLPPPFTSVCLGLNQSEQTEKEGIDFICAARCPFGLLVDGCRLAAAKHGRWQEPLVRWLSWLAP